MHEPVRFRSPEYTAVWSKDAAEQRVSISKEALNHMKAIAIKGYPHEVCGLLVGTLNQQAWHITTVKQVANINTERAADRFQLDPAGYQAVDRDTRGTNMEIIGVFHSHPDCPSKPSPTDLDGAWEGFLYPIVSVCKGEVFDVRYWEPHDNSRQFHPVLMLEATI